MTDHDLHLQLAASAYSPGGELAGVFVIAGGVPADTRCVELSSHPLVPGSKLQLSVVQTGTMPLGKVTVTLVCTEKAVYMAGTSKSVAEKVVAQHTLVDPDQSPDGGALPLIAGFTVPAAEHPYRRPAIRHSGR